MRYDEPIRNASDKGFTLVEVLIVMLISMVLMSAVYAVFLSSSDSYKRLQGLASIQERGRIAMNILQDTIQVADYTGCRATVAINNVLTTAANYEFSFGQGIEGFNSTGTAWSPTIDASIPSPLAAGGDAITVRGPIGSAVQLTAVMGSATAAVSVPAGSPFVINDILMVGDCTGGADVFQKTDAGGAAVTTVAHATGGGSLNGSASLGTAYGTEAMVVKVGTVSFFIRNNTDGIRSLWWKEGAAAEQEIIEGVEAMEILYGVTTNTDTSANRYLTADAVTVWGDVVSVRIGLLIATTKPVLRIQESSSYNLLGTTYTFNDKRQRRIFETNIVLRNRSF